MASQTTLSLRSVAFTDIGKRRRQNEDRLMCDDALRLYGVADGVGGLPGGAEAAPCAVDSIRRRVEASREKLELRSITLAANKEVAESGSRLSPYSGIATTLTWGVFQEDVLHLNHVGDSRCYALRGGILECLTCDHSVANEAKARRARGETVFYADDNRDALTRCIGQRTQLEVDQLVRRVQPGDQYLFCTDGLTRALADTDLEEMMGWILAPEHIVRVLVELANQRSGRDNATGVLVLVGAPQ